MAELEDRGKRTVICCHSVSAVCHCCFNQGRVSVGRLRLLFSRIREKETPAAGLAWRYYTGAQLLKPLVHFWTFSQGLISPPDLVLEAAPQQFVRQSSSSCPFKCGCATSLYVPLFLLPRSTRVPFVSQITTSQSDSPASMVRSSWWIYSCCLNAGFLFYTVKMNLKL